MLDGVMESEPLVEDDTLVDALTLLDVDIDAVVESDKDVVNDWLCEVLREVVSSDDGVDVDELLRDGDKEVLAERDEL